MNNAELRKKSVKELEVELESLCRALFSARMQLATQQNTNTAQLGNIKRNIARVKTLIKERETGLVPNK